MKIRCISLGLLAGILSASVTLLAADPRTEFVAQLNHVIARVNHEAEVDVSGPNLLAEVIQREYGTGAGELKWAVDHSITWGEIAALAYIRATTGRSFEALTKEDAKRDFWTYAESAGMSPQRMARSLESFLRMAEKERNSRIFERLRASRRIQAIPDLGSGFGLYQEALDFRRLDPPRVVKIHALALENAREGQ
jgi:hypothetical protein